MSESAAKALVMVVSRNEAVDTAVSTFQPEILGIISSQNFLGPVARKCADLESRMTVLYRLVDSPMEIHNAFERFEHLLAELESLGYTADDTVLDVSGGTTPMRLGPALAAMQRGIRMVHQRVVQSFIAGDWKVDPERPREVVPMDNPLESTGLLREGQAMQLFDRRDYGAAALVFGDVLAKVTGAERRHYYRGLLLLSEGYAAWDVADYGAALKKLGSARQELSAGFSEQSLSGRASALAGRISAHLSFLGKVRGELSAESVVDMLENARRRILDQGRYDDGVARLYRAVEMFHQWRLKEHNSVSTKDVDWDEVSEDARTKFLEATHLPELPDHLDLTRARALDRILNGDVAEDGNLFRNLLQQRNRSILAHGLEPIGEKAALKFLEYVDGMVGETENRVAASHVSLEQE
ncbi:MAG: TIGR02710 family CRISPR-associated protein [Rubrobacter sp.]|nr:TIGR02710 family CRISPR-associated protein [Rubrobacter sp.]